MKPLLAAVLILLCGCKSLGPVRIGIAASTAADVATTFYALDACPTCSEANPLMEPLVGNPAAFVAAQTALAWFVDKLTRDAYARGDKHWYLPAVAYSALKFALAGNNMVAAH